MTLNSHNLLSSRVPVTDYGNLTADRYQFLGLNQAEPNLGPGADNTVLTITTSNTRVWANSISLTGNIGGNFVLGNGYFLTGIQTTGSLVTNQTLTGDGNTTAFALTTANASSNSILVTTNGLAQTPDVDYVVTGNTVTFSTAPAQGDLMQVRYLANNLTTVTTTYNNSNVAAYLPTFGGNLTAGNVSVSGDIAGGGITQSRVYNVAQLPTAGTAGAGARAFVSNANTTTFYSVVGSGGSNTVPVFSDGVDWRVG